jgi:hypothetical protein
MELGVNGLRGLNATENVMVGYSLYSESVIIQNHQKMANIVSGNVNVIVFVIRK